MSDIQINYTPKEFTEKTVKLYKSSMAICDYEKAYRAIIKLNDADFLKDLHDFLYGHFAAFVEETDGYAEYVTNYSSRNFKYEINSLKQKLADFDQNPTEVEESRYCLPNAVYFGKKSYANLDDYTKSLCESLYVELSEQEDAQKECLKLAKKINEKYKPIKNLKEAEKKKQTNAKMLLLKILIGFISAFVVVAGIISMIMNSGK